MRKKNSPAIKTCGNEISKGRVPIRLKALFVDSYSGAEICAGRRNYCISDFSSGATEGTSTGQFSSMACEVRLCLDRIVSAYRPMCILNSFMSP